MVIGGGRCRSLQLLFVFILLSLCMKPAVGLSTGEGDADIKCIERERQALLMFKQGLIDEYGHLSSWGNEDDKKDCCKWRGVSCSNQTGHVTMLNLQFRSYMPLRGNISSSLIGLQHLNYLNMKYNDFGGKQIPAFIGSLKNIRHLDLSNAGFTGRVPYQLGNLTSLQYLDLSFNFDMLSKKLEWLSQLSFLEHVRLNQVNLGEATDWLQVVSQLPSLTELQLRGCNLPSVIASSSVSFSNSSRSLAHLDLSLNDVSNSVYYWLSNSSSSLVYLDLSSNKLQGSIPDSAFPNPTSLSYLDLSNNQLVSVPKSFRNLCRLRALYQDSNNLTDLLPNLFLKLSNCSRDTLEILQLNSNMLRGSLPDITLFSSLKELHLYDNMLDGSFPRSFGQQSNLSILELDSNQLGGSLPDFSVFLSMKVLYLNNNRFTGTLTKSIGQLSQLELLDVASNSLEGMVTEAHLSNLSRLTYLDLSHNSLILNFGSGWVPSFELNIIRLGACKQGLQFPKWLQTQNKFSELDVSAAEISDTVPNWFWDLSPNLYYLNLSHNHFTGMLPDLSQKFTAYPPEIDLSANSFEGKIPPIPLTVTSLILFKNMFSGSLSFLCQISDEHFRYLDLSDNLLSGELPNCSKNFQKLTVLNLANNKFSGKIPDSMDFNCMMLSLHLRNNSFIGELPSSVKSCTQLTVLDLGHNKISGIIPAWIGDSLPDLVVLSLRSNNFHGRVPVQVCHLQRIQVLDLSQNNISGTVPQCLNNLTAMTANKSSNAMIRYPLRTDYYNDHAFLLSLLGVLDLSNNNLTGKIPSSTQLQSFDASTYSGNPELCGLPLPNKCPGEEQAQDPAITEHADSEDGIITTGFYVSIVLGFIAGFWGVCGTILLNSSWRYEYFRI
ncbi:receptor-like protein EIX1 [Citrus clementina]|uniref:receptor-like protein EIX1 n=1 Tax=Citrus clementina TaxID=85681 RepID=UPI000CED230B|nr:receptor-like protein EIX1 [Citrus x clementina]